MTVLRERDKRFVTLERKIGFFVLFALISIVVTVVLIGIQKDFFTPKEKIHFIADSGTGLGTGQAVKYKGFRIGKIIDVTLNEMGKVEVTLSITSSYMKLIKKDAVASLVQENVIGDMIIEIKGGSRTQDLVENNGYLMFERSISINDIAQEMKTKLDIAFDEVKKVTDYVNNPEGDVKQTIANVNKLTHDFVETRQSVNDLIFEVHDIVRKDVKRTISTVGKTMAQVDATLVNVNETIDSLDDSLQQRVLPRVEDTLDLTNETIDAAGVSMTNLEVDVQFLMKKLDLILDNVMKISEDVKAATPQIPYLLNEGNELIKDTSEILDSVKKRFGTKEQQAPVAQGPLTVDSYE